MTVAAISRLTAPGRVRQYEHPATLLPLANVAENQGPISGIMLYSCNRPEADSWQASLHGQQFARQRTITKDACNIS